jgi:hypothetical protein
VGGEESIVTCALPFDDAGAGATFSADRAHRFRLWRRWGTNMPACFLLLNPSVANETQLDPTLRRCRSFAKAWGCGGMVVVNLFALVSPYPEALLTHPDPVGDGNDEAIARAARESSIVIAGWGAHPKAKERAEHVVDMLRGVCELKCLGKTKDGHPRHPLYVRGDTVAVPFAIREGAMG